MMTQQRSTALGPEKHDILFFARQRGTSHPKREREREPSSRFLSDYLEELFKD